MVWYLKMSELIVQIGNIQNLSSVDMIGFLDPNHKKISPEMKKEILIKRYHGDLISDGLESGILTMNQWGIIEVNSKQNLPTIKGFVLESFLVRMMNENKQIGMNAFNWCSNRKRGVNNDFFDEYHAIGTGFLSTKNQYLTFYEPQSNADIKFIRKNNYNIWELALRVDAKIPAGIQIKAITSNEKHEIIKPLINGKYTHVVTCLNSTNGIHSFDICMDIIKSMYNNNEIDHNQRENLEKSIFSPSKIGIDQYDINNYSEYIDYWYQGQAHCTLDIKNTIDKEIIGYKYNQSGLLIPDYLENNRLSI